MEVYQFYSDGFGISSPFQHQIEVWQKFRENRFPLLLKAPTGSGKTETVLAPFLKQFTDNKYSIAPRLIYTLPMRVLVDSVANRIKEYIGRLRLDISVDVHHGDVPNSPFFISDIVVTTLDQFLYGFSRASRQVGYHLDVPAGAIASSLVVFDEAHMYRDSFTFSIMRALMEILYTSKIPFVVITATMPTSLGDSLFEHIKEYNIVTTESFDLGNSASIFIKEEPIYENGEVKIDDELFEKIKSKKTLIVLNQVTRAQKVYESIKKRLGLGVDIECSEVVLLHSRFKRADRERHEKKALEIMKCSKDNPRIVVSTQVLEAGMDFSAELLITELAPADALIQRAGRCARYKDEHGEIVICPVEEEKGHLPYEKEHLDKTLKWLKENRSFNVRDSNDVCSFVDILDYKAIDIEARDTLIDLHECVLYADSSPGNIQLRDGKPVYLVVVNLAEGDGRSTKDRIKNTLRKAKISENTINVDLNYAWKLFKEQVLQIGIDYNFESKEWNVQEITEIQPFKYYIIDSSHYEAVKGISLDASTVF